MEQQQPSSDGAGTPGRAGAMQVFLWHGPGSTKQDGRTYYQRFSLNGVVYQISDFVYLYPESDDDYPHYIGKIQAAFVDDNSNLQDPHCIEIKWFERRTNLEPSTKGIEESEKEVFELDDTDINPIGCISGKCTIVRATHYENAWHKMKNHEGTDWYFCRGYFRQATNSFEAYTLEEINEGAPPQPQALPVRGYPGGYSHSPVPTSQGFEDGDDLPSSKRKATGRACLQCGATSTPQWREGPEGPKTLCNACGVRYVRSLQKGGQRKSSGGPAAAAAAAAQAYARPQAPPPAASAPPALQKNLKGRLTELTTPQAQQSNTVASPRARQSALRTEPRRPPAPRLLAAAAAGSAAAAAGGGSRMAKVGQRGMCAGKHDAPTPAPALATPLQA